jgi:hypothetical protein
VLIYFLFSFSEDAEKLRGLIKSQPRPVKSNKGSKMKLMIDEKERSALSKSEKSIVVESVKHGEGLITGQKGNQYTSRILPKNNEIDASKFFNDSKMIVEHDENKSSSSFEKSKLFIDNQMKSGN